MQAAVLRAQLHAAVTLVRSHMPAAPDVGLIPGTGSGAPADALRVQAALPIDDIPHIPRSAAPSHAVRLLPGELIGVNVAVMQRRYHYCEGCAMQHDALPVRLPDALEKADTETIIRIAARAEPVLAAVLSNMEPSMSGRGAA